MNVRKRQSYNTKGMTDKADCQKWHCMKRIRERFGLQLAESRYIQLINSIQDPEYGQDKGITVEFIRKQSNRVYEFRVKMDECSEEFIACYDVDRKTMVTVLFPLGDGIHTIHQYFDYFGNTVNARTEYGRYFELDLNKNELSIPSTDTELIERTEEHIKWVSEDRKIWTWNRQMEQLSMELNVEW